MCPPLPPSHPPSRPRMADNLRLRHHIVKVIRRFLEDDHGFLEVGLFLYVCGALEMWYGGKSRLHHVWVSVILPSSRCPIWAPQHP